MEEEKGLHSKLRHLTSSGIIVSHFINQLLSTVVYVILFVFHFQCQLLLEYHHDGNQLQKSKHCAAPHHLVSLSFLSRATRKKAAGDLIEIANQERLTLE